jgi:lactate dehydrogenase-like 2-hydroxyacid dehydrogenase
MNILVGSALPPAIVSALREIGTVHVLPAPEERDAFLARVGGTINSLIWPPLIGELPPALVSNLPTLKHIAAMGAGYETIDVVDAAKRGVCVTNTPRAVTEDTADAAFYLVLATVRRFPAAERFIRAGRWTLQTLPERTDSLRGKTIGVVGFGRIGKAIARRAEAFGLDIVYHARTQKIDVPYPWIPSLEETARRSDILLSVLPGGEETRGLVGRPVFEALGPRGVFINIGRGTVVDEPALVAALRDGTIAGAGLDVFANEPDVPADLIAMENVVLLPHVGGATHQLYDAIGRDLVENVRAVKENRPPPDAVPEAPWMGRPPTF